MDEFIEGTVRWGKTGLDEMRIKFNRIHMTGRWKRDSCGWKTVSGEGRV